MPWTARALGPGVPRVNFDYCDCRQIAVGIHPPPYRSPEMMKPTQTPTPLRALFKNSARRKTESGSAKIISSNFCLFFCLFHPRAERKQKQKSSTTQLFTIVKICRLKFLIRHPRGNETDCFFFFQGISIFFLIRRKNSSRRFQLVCLHQGDCLPASPASGVAGHDSPPHNLHHHHHHHHPRHVVRNMIYGRQLKYDHGPRACRVNGRYILLREAGEHASKSTCTLPRERCFPISPATRRAAVAAWVSPFFNLRRRLGSFLTGARRECVCDGERGGIGWVAQRLK